MTGEMSSMDTCHHRGVVVGWINVALVMSLLLSTSCGEIDSSQSALSESALSVRATSITFWERTGGKDPMPFTFAANAEEMLNRRPNPLSKVNHDFCGVCPGEFYDVFYSDDQGNFDVAGDFVTVEAVWNQALPAGGGLNLAEVQLNFEDGTSLFASNVTSYVAIGNNVVKGSEKNAADGNKSTHTVLGNTAGLRDARLRVTVGFKQPNHPPDCTRATGLPASIWPPDHRFVAVNIGGIIDPDKDPVTVEIASVFQDEPVDSTGDGRFSPDAQIMHASALLRAERSGLGDGRVYHVDFKASDGRGGICKGRVQVCVPGDQRPGAGCVDQGPRYDSTAR